MKETLLLIIALALLFIGHELNKARDEWVMVFTTDGTYLSSIRFKNQKACSDASLEFLSEQFKAIGNQPWTDEIRYSRCYQLSKY